MIKVLVLEDDRYLNEIIKSYLISRGYEVLSVFNGKEALDSISKEIFELYILDIMVPMGNGLDILKTIRESTNNPALIITALDNEDTEIKAFKRGVDDYITKPFSPNKLIMRVEAILRRSNKLNNDLIEFRGYEINYKNFTIRYNGENIELLKKEFEVLEILIKNSGIVLSREKILDKVWGYDYFGSDRVVDAQIKNLRKKLKTDIIKTIKGVGYIIGD